LWPIGWAVSPLTSEGLPDGTPRGGKRTPGMFLNALENVTAVLFTIAKIWKQPRSPTTNEWIKKMWYLYTMDFYSATKNEIFSFASKWMELENIHLKRS
jgi:hypothetical protein